MTAVAPNAVVDSGATLFYTFSMLTDLCQVYNLRAGRTGTAVLLGRVFFNAYLAGQGTEWEKLAEDQYDQLFARGDERGRRRREFERGRQVARQGRREGDDRLPEPHAADPPRPLLDAAVAAGDEIRIAGPESERASDSTHALSLSGSGYSPVRSRNRGS